MVPDILTDGHYIHGLGCCSMRSRIVVIQRQHCMRAASQSCPLCCRIVTSVNAVIRSVSMHLLGKWRTMGSVPSGLKAQYDMKLSSPHPPATLHLQNIRPSCIARAREAPPGGGMQRRAVLARHSLRAGTSHALCSRSPPYSHPVCMILCVSLL